MPRKAKTKQAETPEEVFESVQKEVIEEIPERVPKGAVRVVAVIRPMYAPYDELLIPEGGAKGVLIQKNSWAIAQLERGLLRIVE